MQVIGLQSKTLGRTEIPLICFYQWRAIAMRYLAWAIKLVIFVFVVLFAYKNTAPVEVVFFDGILWSDVPLIVVMLVTFAVGGVLGVAIMLPSTWRGRREAGRLKKDLNKAQSLVDQSKSAATVTDSTPL
jgi:uncharacterized integral membrane protein